MAGSDFAKKTLWLRYGFVFLVISLLYCGKLASANEIEFNTDILDVKDKENIDLSRFSQAGYIMPGNYTLALNVNGEQLSEHPIDWFTPDDNKKDSKPCITSELVKEFALKPVMQSQLIWWHQGQCLNVNSVPGMEARGDLGASSLYVSIPQAYLEYRAPNWDPPSLWDDGISGAIFDYYASAQTRHEDHDGTSTSINGNGTTGINIGSWRLRADWQGRYGDEESSNSHWDWSRYYAYRALPHLRAKLILGESSLYSDIFDSFSYTGASLVSDDNMLPPNLRGYAPEVSGIAKTNAKVVISQQGRVIQETQVAAGAFRIQNLNEMVSGELNVRVEEQDGSVQEFKVNTASVPYLTRPGLVRYKIAAGRPSDTDHHVEGSEFATGEFSWGVTNGWSLYGGAIGSEDYSSLAIGIGRDLMAFGALSFDVTESRARNLPDNQSGASYRLSYSKRFDETDSEMTFAGYRFSERGYMSMGEYLDSKKFDTGYGDSKEMYTATFNQQFRDFRLSAYLNYSHQTYWNRPDNDRFTLTLSQYFDVGEIHDISLSATMYRNKYYDTNDDGMYLSLSMPWGDNGSLSYNGTYDSDNSTHEASYYGTVDERNNYQISGGLSGNRSMARAYYNHQADIAQINVNTSYHESSYSSMSLSAQGGITATPEGAALHRSGVMGGARMMLDTVGVRDIPMKSYGANTSTNRFGKAVVSDISGYHRSKISVDLNELPDDAEVMGSVVQATLTEGAIGYRKFDVVSGAKAMGILRLENGDAPPFGATVQNMKHQYVGVVSDEGNVYLSGIQAGGIMQVLWGGKVQCQLEMPNTLPVNVSQRLLLPCRVVPVGG